jgi:phosphoglycerate dehydrogenase-like enzyme
VSERPLAVYVDPLPVDLHDAPRLLAEGGFELREVVAPSAAAVLDELTGVTALLTGEAQIDAGAIAALSSTLRLIVTASVGYDHIDLAAARDAGIWVCNVPDAASEEVAVHALALALDLIRHVTFLDRHVRAGGFRADANTLPRRPSGLTLGIVGMGRIGQLLATRAEPVFGSVVATDPLVDPAGFPEGVRPVELEPLLEQSHVVSLHLPLTTETAGLLDARRLALMPPGAFLVNVSRAGLVDQDALVAALNAGRLGGAAVDVFLREPADADDPGRRHPRMIATPHTAYWSDVAERAYMSLMAENAVAWLRNGRPRTPVVQGRDS